MGKTGISLDTALADFATAFAAGSDNFGTVEFRSPEPVVEPRSRSRRSCGTTTRDVGE